MTVYNILDVAFGLWSHGQRSAYRNMLVAHVVMGETQSCREGCC